MTTTAAGLVARQLWNLPTPTSSVVSPTSVHCTAFTLPSNGILSFADTAITLTTNVVFQPECTGQGSQGVSTVEDLKDPFYASTIPQTYVIAAATVIAWVLVVMLIITPRTSFLGNPGATQGFSNGHGIIGGATGGGTSLIGIGSRPWLQKVAALMVAVSLTVATADTFKVARQQYVVGYMDATALRDQVLGSLEIRITAVISDVFLWLAQVQTLIRLFPRHKEKVLIKWIGFALIVLDSVFSCLNSFLVDSTARPRHFADAIPALSYLFELALGLLYAAWVIYYSLTKRRYAFYHSKMRNICLIALLSLIAVLTPVVFFVTDVSNEDVAGWGDYFRWVGAAAASVVVWEWVERIEALERDERKDGILGREIFDGDEMLDVTPSDEAIWMNGRNRRRRDGGDDQGGNQTSALEYGLSGVAQRFRRGQRHESTMQHFPLGGAHSTTTTTIAEPTQAPNGNHRIAFGHLPKPADEQQSPADNALLGSLTPPPVVASPLSRTDTASAASTVYVVRYDTVPHVPQPVRRRVERDASGNLAQVLSSVNANPRNTLRKPDKEDAEEGGEDREPASGRHRGSQWDRWHSVANPFKRKRASPPAEVQQARQQSLQQLHSQNASPARAATPTHNFSRWDVKNRLGVLAAQTGDRMRDRAAGRRQEPHDLPLTVIPAQPRGSGRTWSPQDFRAEAQTPISPAEGNTIASSSSAAVVDGSSGFTTLTANSSSAAGLSPHRQFHGPSSPKEISLGGADATASRSNVLTAARHSAGRPPRADDISPVGDSSGTTVVVPAPRRSPLRISTPAAPVSGPSNFSGGSGGSGSARDDG